MQDLETFYGPNAGYVLDLYERYTQNPEAVDAATRAVFDTWSPETATTTPLQATQSTQVTQTPQPTTQPSISTTTATVKLPTVAQAVAASALAHAIRERGHLGAHLDPLGS